MILSRSVWNSEGGINVPNSGLSGANKVIGTKQTLKAVEKGLVKAVFVAADAEQHVVKPLIQRCQEKDIPVIMIDTMKNLGKACGIEVGCAAAAMVNE